MLKNPATEKPRRPPRRHPGYRAADRRRAAIIDALRRSMLERGFAGTSLTELAKRAGMSVSHFLYYFPDKETVLAELAKSFTDQTLEFIGALTPKAPQEQCRELVKFFFGGRAVPPSYRNLVLQTMGVATHDRKLLARQRQQAGRFRAYLRQLFRKSPGTTGMKVDDAAAIAGAIWMGLYVNSYFDPALTMSRAARLMLTTMSWLGDFEGKTPAANGIKRSAARRKTGPTPRPLKQPSPVNGSASETLGSSQSG